MRLSAFLLALTSLVTAQGLCTQDRFGTVPARVWHQVVLEPGTEITYMLINVSEPE